MKSLFPSASASILESFNVFQNDINSSEETPQVVERTTTTSVTEKYSDGNQEQVGNVKEQLDQKQKEAAEAKNMSPQQVLALIKSIIELLKMMKPAEAKKECEKSGENPDRPSAKYVKNDIDRILPPHTEQLPQEAQERIKPAKESYDKLVDMNETYTKTYQEYESQNNALTVIQKEKTQKMEDKKKLTEKKDALQKEFENTDDVTRKSSIENEVEDLTAQEKVLDEEMTLTNTKIQTQKEKVKMLEEQLKSLYGAIQDQKKEYAQNLEQIFDFMPIFA